MKNLLKSLLIILITLTTFQTSAQWTKAYYVDDFGDKTEQAYLGYIAEGIFSNSATNGSRLKVLVVVDKGRSLRFKVFEYGNNPANFSPDHITVKTKSILNGEPQVLEFRANQSGANVYLKKVEKDGMEDFIELLKKSTSISVMFRETSKYSSSSYVFKIDATGFTKAYNSL